MSLVKHAYKHSQAAVSVLLIAAIPLSHYGNAGSLVAATQPPAHPGWEVSQDVALPARAAGSRVFRAELTFTATPSNNVEAAFGKDSDADRRLSAEETAATVGWDRGAWFLRSSDLLTVFTNAPSGNTPATARTLRMAVRLDAAGTPTSLSFSDRDGNAVTFDGLEGVPPWISPGEWDTAALTARGRDVRDEAARFSFMLDGTHILLR